MKLLYITHNINEEGGIQRVIATKTNYFIENFGYQISILTQNEGNIHPFFIFNEKIKMDDIPLKSNKIFNLIHYKKKIQEHIHALQPDCIVVCDFALKSFSIPLLLKTKIPIVFEAHGSRFNEYKQHKGSPLFWSLKYNYRNFCAKKFSHFVALSPESLAEWTVKNGLIIANPLWFKTDELSTLTSKKVIAVARHSYEKGIDRLLQIWKLVSPKQPDWKLEIYGKPNEDLKLEELAKQLKIENSVRFLNPVISIQDKYIASSLFAMTSRNEALPMVLIEAMACGLPCIAYDCPVGPRAIIQNSSNGFLIEDGNSIAFAEKLNTLMTNQELRTEMGKNAQKSISKYDLDTIMIQWKNFFEMVQKA